MKEGRILTRALALVGTLLVWLPLLAPVAFWLLRLAGSGGIPRNFDYLMPAELFPVALLGGALLLWGAFRARSHLAGIAWSFGASVAALVAMMVLASVTGLATGASEPEGWRFALVVGMLAAFIIALAVLGVLGVLLVVALMKPEEDRDGLA